VGDRLAGKTALVTGGGSGIGRASAVRFASEGAFVAVNDINEKGVRETVAMIEGAGGKAIAAPGDVSNSHVVNEIVETLVRRSGGVDVLLNCAFFMTVGLVGDLTDEQWRSNYTVTLDGTFYTMRAVLPHMKKQRGGSIINISSGGAVRQEVTIGPYCAAKRAILSITETVAIEYGREGIRCNAICPGPIATPPLLAFVAQMPGRPGKKAEEIYDEQLPMGRMGQPNEMANVALFLASDEASYVNGATIVADSGVAVRAASPKFEN
jgi:meso-butanediol dehydrogenase/(S,S)-butanediol dehydrogenase/diacetyl reductase